MNNLKIGIFDSGVGGLTTLKEIRKIMPQEDIVYFGDTLRVPYGNRSKNTIIEFAKQDIDFLLLKGVKAIIVACGTVSSCLKSVDLNLSIPIFKVVEPTAKAALKATKNNNIGVIATSATVKTGAYERELKRLNPKLKIFSKECPLLVPLVEENLYKNAEIAKNILGFYLSSFIKQNVDTLILGCTHYALLKKLIKDIMGENVKLIDSGKETATYVSKVLNESKISKNSTQKGRTEYFVSGDIENFVGLAKVFLKKDYINNVTKV